MDVHPAKTLISLGICPVWSVFTVAWRKLGSLVPIKHTAKTLGQTGRMPRLIWVFPGRTVRMAERLAIPTLDHGVAGSNGEILPEPKRRFIAQSLSCSPFHRLEMTEILLKGRKTLTHPSSHFVGFVMSQLILSRHNCDRDLDLDTAVLLK